MNKNDGPIVGFLTVIVGLVLLSLVYHGADSYREHPVTPIESADIARLLHSLLGAGIMVGAPVIIAVICVLCFMVPKHLFSAGAKVARAMKEPKPKRKARDPVGDKRELLRKLKEEEVGPDV